MNNNNMNGNNSYQRLSPGMYRAPNGRTVNQQQMERTMQRNPGQFQQAPQQQMQPQQQQMQQNWNQLSGAPMDDRYQRGVQDIASRRGFNNQELMDNNQMQPGRFNQMFGGQMMQPRQGGGASIDPGFSMDPNQMRQIMPQGMGQAYGQAPMPQGSPQQMQFRPGTDGHQMMLARNAKTNQQRAQHGVVNQQPQGLLSMPPKMAGRNQY
jgi:hypothetical protein